MAERKYDYLFVGAGLYGAVFAHEMTKRGKKCLVVERRNHIADNIYTEEIEGINVHRCQTTLSDINANISALIILDYDRMLDYKQL